MARRMFGRCSRMQTMARRATAARVARSADRVLAQRCSVVHVPSVFSRSDILAIFALRERHRSLLGQSPNARRGWRTTYISADGLFREHEPELLARCSRLTQLVDPRLFAAEDSDSDGDSELVRAVLAELQLQVRCAEVHEAWRGGSLSDPTHYDIGSVVTVDVMLDDAFEGGQLQTLEADGELRTHEFGTGDALIFPSYKYHTVAPVTGGLRQTLVLEFWRGEECRCNHRREVPIGDCAEAEQRATQRQEDEDGDALLDWVGR